MRILIFTLVFAGIFSIGCARLRVEGPKEPIKLDITMRLDVYQHVTKDIDAIESMVNAPAAAPKKSNGQSLLHLFVGYAYAQEGLSPEVQEAVKRRRDRLSELSSLESAGIVGENKSGLVEIRGKGDAGAQALVSAENSDRMVIYQSVAKKNGTSVSDVQMLYAKRLQNDAPAGTPIEVVNESNGALTWKIK
jgi:uncharacterized protein YdbL (DUF1318 family)